MAYAFEEHHLVVEGAGAVGLAALLYSKVSNLGSHVVVVLSGGNVDVDVLTNIVKQRKELYEGRVKRNA